MVLSATANHPGPEAANPPEFITLPLTVFECPVLFFHCVGFMSDVTEHPASEKFLSHRSVMEEFYGSQFCTLPSLMFNHICCQTIAGS